MRISFFSLSNFENLLRSVKRNTSDAPPDPQLAPTGESEKLTGLPQIKKRNKLKKPRPLQLDNDSWPSFQCRGVSHENNSTSIPDTPALPLPSADENHEATSESQQNSSEMNLKFPDEKCTKPQYKLSAFNSARNKSIMRAPTESIAIESVYSQDSRETGSAAVEKSSQSLRSAGSENTAEGPSFLSTSTELEPRSFFSSKLARTHREEIRSRKK